MFDSMIQQTRQVVTSGLCRGELEAVVAGSGRAMAALSALQTRCATEIEALDDGGVNSKTVLREAGRMSTRSANRVAKTAAGLAEMPKLAESLANGKISVEHATVAVGAAAKTSAEQVDSELSKFAEVSSVDVFAEQSRQWVNRNQTNDGSELYQQQRRHRSLKHWVNAEVRVCCQQSWIRSAINKRSKQSTPNMTGCGVMTADATVPPTRFVQRNNA